MPLGAHNKNRFNFHQCFSLCFTFFVLTSKVSLPLFKSGCFIERTPDPSSSPLDKELFYICLLINKAIIFKFPPYLSPFAHYFHSFVSRIPCHIIVTDFFLCTSVFQQSFSYGQSKNKCVKIQLSRVTCGSIWSYCLALIQLE